MKCSPGTIACELARHAPFTALGAASGVLLLLGMTWSGTSGGTSEVLFYVLHPAHVFLSALVTTAMYVRRGGGLPAAPLRFAAQAGKLWTAVLVGYTGSVGMGTLSDAVFPFLGGTLLGLDMEMEMPFIELGPAPYLFLPKAVLVNGLGLAGVAAGLARPSTRLPHAGHVLVSTWASLFGLTAFGRTAAEWVSLAPLVFVVLFVAVWLPCCFSDIVYPLLWTKRGQGEASTGEHAE